MFSRIAQQNAISKKIKIMTHIVVGYPTIEDSFQIAMTMVQSGVDAIELQIPFSDPVADGPTILLASEQSLAKGTKVNDAFVLAKRLRENGVEIPLLFMTYVNIVYAQGIEKFVQKSVKNGIDGFIIPDLPLDTEEGEDFLKACQETNTEMIPLFAPSMTNARIKEIASYAKNIVYAVSRTGITGTKGFSEEIDEYLSTIKKSTTAHIALGFGIQSKEQVKSLYGKTEYAVIGSHILRIFEKEGIFGIEKFLKEIQL